MSVFNLGVVFGPTLLRPQEETVAAILDIKFNNIVINILIDNYERIFKNDPSTVSTHLQNNSSSPPVRVPRSSQSKQALLAGGGGGSVGRNSMYSPQQQVYRVVAKSNFTDSPMSSSLQNIPNGMIYGTTGSGGSVGSSGVITSNGTNGGGHMSSHATNGGSSGPKSLGMSVNMGSVKNLHSMSQSDISMRRNNTNDPVYGILTANTNGGLTAHHATPANATNLRHDYLMATATPASTSIYGTNASGNRISLNNVSPPTLAMRKEALYGGSGSVGTTTNGPQQHPPVQLQRSNHLPYAQNKHYSSAAAASTSSSNESVCDSLSSTNGGGGTGSSRFLSARGSIDYVPHSSQATSLSTLLGSQVDDVVTATAAPSMIVGSTGSSEYTPQKMHRNKDVNQIKRDLDAGTAYV